MYFNIRFIYVSVDGDNDTKSSSDILDASPDERKMSSQLLKVFRNVPFMSLAFAEGFVSLLGAGMSAFMPKLVENQFSLPASYTALIVGKSTSIRNHTFIL